MISERWWRRATLWVVAATALSLAGLRPAHAQTPLTIAQLRGQTVGGTTEFTARGIVTAISVNTNGCYIEDSNGGAGIMVFGVGTYPQVGDDVTIIALLQGYSGSLEFNITGTGSGMSVNSSGNAVPAPKAITVPQAQTFGPAPSYTHKDQGLLVTIPNLTVTSPLPGAAGANGSTYVVDPNGVQILLYVHKNSTSGAATPPGAPANPVVKASVQPGNIYTLTGILSYFGTATPANDPTKVQILVRNADDLLQMGTAPFFVSSASFTPSPIDKGTSTKLVVKTVPPTGSAITADLSSVGGSATQSLAFNSTSNSYEYTLDTTNSSLGYHSIRISAQNGANTTSAAVPLTVYAALQAVTIAQARALPDYSKVSITGTVTAATVGAAKTYYLQDDSGGVYLFSSGTDIAGNEGDIWTITGVKTTFNGGVEIDYTSMPGGGTPGSGTVPSPKLVTSAQWGANPNVGLLVTTKSLMVLSAVTSVAAPNYAFVVTDGTSVGELYIASRSVIDPASLVVGQSYDVTGPLDYYGPRNVFEIKPRRAGDITAGTAPALPSAVAFSTQPVGGIAGAPLATQPVVTLQNSSNATFTAYNGPVSLTLKGGTEGVVLSGIAIVTAVNGIATFSALSIDKAGAGYQLTASAINLTADSASFSVNPAVVKGDLNNDGGVGQDDVVAALRIFGGLQALPMGGLPAGDVYPAGSPDGVFDLRDIIHLVRFVTHTDPTL